MVLGIGRCGPEAASHWVNEKKRSKYFGDEFEELASIQIQNSNDP